MVNEMESENVKTISLRSFEDDSNVCITVDITSPHRGSTEEATSVKIKRLMEVGAGKSISIFNEWEIFSLGCDEDDKLSRERRTRSEIEL